MSKAFIVKRIQNRSAELSNNKITLTTKEYNNIVDTINFLTTELGIVLTHDITPDSPQKAFIEVHPEIFEEVLSG